MVVLTEPKIHLTHKGFPLYNGRRARSNTQDFPLAFALAQAEKLPRIYTSFSTGAARSAVVLKYYKFLAQKLLIAKIVPGCGKTT